MRLRTHHRASADGRRPPSWCLLACGVIAGADRRSGSPRRGA
ncbi:hypothetical protein BN2537_5041 [Streptomyces venezuelae]|nr:hypothetical protein BN2537_5041 [Streptomyces venezuelae]